MRDGPSENVATLLGVMAICFWSTSFATSGSLATEIGSLTAAALAFIIGGTLGLMPLAVSPFRRRHLFAMRPDYLIICGGLVAIYAVSIYLAVGLAKDSQQVLEVSVLNYLFPTCTLLFSIPILKARARPTLALGVGAAFAGALLALTNGRSFDWSSLWVRLESDWLPYLLGFCAAVSWALYSVLSRRLAAGSKGNAVPLFILFAGLVLLGCSAVRGEAHHWSARAIGELFFMALIPILLAYVFWDMAMRRGRIVLVTALSYFTPVLSLLTTSLYLKAPAGPRLWIGGLLVTVGAIICAKSLHPPEETSPAPATAARTEDA